MEFIKSHLASGSGPNILVTHPPNNRDSNGPSVNESTSGHYAGNQIPSEQNNIYLNRIAIERLENTAKAYLKNHSAGNGGSFANEMFNVLPWLVNSPPHPHSLGYFRVSVLPWQVELSLSLGCVSRPAVVRQQRPE
jgi:hypothetical protein